MMIFHVIMLESPVAPLMPQEWVPCCMVMLAKSEFTTVCCHNLTILLFLQREESPLFLSPPSSFVIGVLCLRLIRQSFRTREAACFPCSSFPFEFLFRCFPPFVFTCSFYSPSPYSITLVCFPPSPLVFFLRIFICKRSRCMDISVPLSPIPGLSLSASLNRAPIIFFFNSPISPVRILSVFPLFQCSLSSFSPCPVWFSGGCRS